MMTAPLQYIKEVSSTNDCLRELVASVEEPLPEGFTVTAGFQSKGRGQMGNCWISDPGENILFSILFYPSFLVPQKQFPLSMAVSLAVLHTIARGVSEELRKKFSIKWPNDIYYEGKKIAGILIENQIMGKNISHSIVGIGLNVNQEHFPASLPNPISLKNITSREYDLSQLAVALQKELLLQYESLMRVGYDAISIDYHNRLFRRHQFAEFTDGKEIFTAKIERVEEDGRMILCDVEGRERSYYFKEVFFTDLRY